MDYYTVSSVFHLVCRLEPRERLQHLDLLLDEELVQLGEVLQAGRAVQRGRGEGLALGLQREENSF